ncbi:uncharacterized protein LAESUDRAFT_543559 [Laetiporus sulphureus 93-53]|uniref:Uncharacterized protein n=1 Tax=Laetiporus sulphureus 93-53 TaxID=1314785 RepID=A0A165FN69_9APHY|nr:uncharacterized protein LAESUDRAFT_543559 [Laetiporus sulphureus 93-53]KZT09221.1 hypothetical protein LAESUDRAFT_543559 [Laetiporus sulphureus 93-53]
MNLVHRWSSAGLLDPQRCSAANPQPMGVPCKQERGPLSALTEAHQCRVPPPDCLCFHASSRSTSLFSACLRIFPASRRLFAWRTLCPSLSLGEFAYEYAMDRLTAGPRRSERSSRLIHGALVSNGVFGYCLARSCGQWARAALSPSAVVLLYTTLFVLEAYFNPGLDSAHSQSGVPRFLVNALALFTCAHCSTS